MADAVKKMNRVVEVNVAMQMKYAQIQVVENVVQMIHQI